MSVHYPTFSSAATQLPMAKITNKNLLLCMSSVITAQLVDTLLAAWCYVLIVT